MEPAPEVSVVLPTRNRAGLLRGALASVLSQRGVDLEVIVVDDASDDATAETVSAVGDPRVRLLRQEWRMGVARARNRAVEDARAPWLAFLDDDDLWAPDRLRTHLDAATADGATVVYGGRIVVDAQRRPISAVLPEAPADVPALLRWGNVLGSPSGVMATATAVRAAGGFDVRLSALADWKLWLQLAATERLAASPDLLVAYTEHPGNMHRTDPWGVLEEFRFLQGEPWGLEARSFLHWIATGLLESGRRRDAATAFLLAARTGAPRDLLLSVAALTAPLSDLTAPARRPLESPQWLRALAGEA
jgi:glycosyltransferase involved in cell wall biosynthesis